MGNRTRFATRARAPRKSHRLTVAATATTLMASVLLAVPFPAAATPKATWHSGPTPTTSKQVTNLPKLNDGYGPTAAQQQAMTAAAQTARDSNKPVVVSGLTTETQQVTAKPGGGFSLSVNPKPVRTVQHGTWVPVDTTLHTNANGTLSPAATAYATVTFSNGGTTPLATTTSGGQSYAVSWPTALPKPRISDSTATYPDALPGVDLDVSATVDGGFSEVLVVKTTAAAKNPALATLTLPTTTTGGTLDPDGHGGLHLAGRTGGDTLVSATPLMWDSNTKPSKQQGTPDASDATHPGLAAHTALVRTHVSKSSLALVPDTHLLTDPSTVLPVYIDPTFNWHPTTGGTPAFDEVKRGEPCTNSSFFDNSGAAGDDGQLGVGYNQFDSCFGPMRAYYQWQLPTVIWGAHIGNVSGQPGAAVDVRKLFSQYCGVSSTITLHVTGGIGSGTSWNSQPATMGTVSSQSIGPAWNDNCTNYPQPSAGFDVTGQIAAAAAQHASQFTVDLTGNESSASHEFGRFTDNPTLQIFYNLIPNTPGPGQMDAQTGSDHVGCATATPYPYMGKTITTNTPVLTAGISDPDGDHLQATYHYWIDGSSTVNSGLSGDNLASGTNAQFSLPSSFTSGLTNGQVVDWQVQVSDGEDASGWSPVCHFIAEPTAPSAPAISSADGVYPNNGTVGAATGTPGRFTLSSTGGTVSKIENNLDQPPPTSAPPAADNAPFSPGGVITNAARWKLGEGSGTTGADSSGNNHPVTLSNATWATDPTRGAVLSLNGSTGYAATTAPVVNTAGSFTVSAWVDLASTSAYETFVTQEGSTVGGFYLEYDSDVNKWTFARFANDSPATVEKAQGGPTPVVNTWTHLAGVYDASSGAMTLYVNGVQAATATDTTPWNATGPLIIGHGWFNGANNNYVNGSISDVQLYQAPLSASDIVKVSGGGVDASVGRWKFAEGSGATATDTSGGNHPATLAGGYTWNTTSTPGITFDGSTGYAATSGPVLTTTGSYSVSAWVRLASTANYFTAVSQGGANAASFYLQYSLSANAWAFVSPSGDATSNVTYASAHASSAPTLNTWTNLVGVFDSSTGKMSLYVNGALAGTATNTSPWNAPGALALGGVKLTGGGANNFFNGSISDVQTYSSALGASEAAMIYESSTINVTPRSPGPHTLYGYTADPAGDVSGYQAYSFVAAHDPNTACTSLAACYDNTGISPDSNHALGNLDGVGNSLSATDLNTAGWTSGGSLTVDGGTFQLPAFGSGQPDNVLAANQTVTFNQSVAKTGATALEFLVTGSYAGDGALMPGSVAGDNTVPAVPPGTDVTGVYCFTGPDPTGECAPSGTITFKDGKTQPYDLTVPDWVVGPESIDTIWTPHENTTSGQNTTNDPKLYTFAVPLRSDEAGGQIASVTLPDVGTQVGQYEEAMHVFSMATRDTSVGNGVTDASGQTWTGAWGAPSEGVFNQGSTYNNQTWRETVTPSISGGTVRLKFDDALGIYPLDIGAATVAVQSNQGSPVPAATPTQLTFGTGQSPSVVVPEGGMVYSNPVSLPVTAGQSLLVSFNLTNTIPWLVTDTNANNGTEEWISAAGTGSAAQTMDTTGTPFTGTGTTNGGGTSVVTDLDVVTSGTPTEAVLGDGFIDQANTGKGTPASTNLIGDLAADESTTPAPYGLVGEGMESNQLVKDYPEANGSGPAALSRIDRDILDQPNLGTVVLDEGLEDVLAGANVNSLTANAYSPLLGYLESAGVNVILVGLTPCDGYAGDGVSPNDPCTSSVDSQRVAVNGWLSSNDSSYLALQNLPAVFYLNPDPAVGVPDTANGETKLAPAADGGDHVNLTDAGYAALANSYLGSQDTWPIDDGANGATTATTLADFANNASNPYLVNNSLAGANVASLSGTPNWQTDSTRGEVLDFDGSTNYAQTTGPVLNTTGDFTVSAWVKLDSGANTGVIVSQSGVHGSAFSLRYDTSGGENTWSFTVTNTDTGTVYDNSTNWADADVDSPVGKWVQVAATYNVNTQTQWIYVNGQPVEGFSTGDNIPFNATGPLVIGADLVNGGIGEFFPGEISDVQAWNYTLDDAQINSLYQGLGTPPAG